MYCLATKFHCASQSIYNINRHTLRMLDVAKVPMIMSKYMSNGGPCGGGCPPSEQKAGGGSGGSGKHQIQFKAYKPPAYKPHDYKNMHLKRPMSPHLMIYAPTLPAMTSILQRITGTIATFYAILMSAGALFLSNGVDSIVSAIQSLELGRFSVLIIKIILGAPFAYHYLNGIRFVAFNMGRWLMRKEVYGTAQKVVIASIAVTLLFAVL